MPDTSSKLGERAATVTQGTFIQEAESLQAPSSLSVHGGNIQYPKLTDDLHKLEKAIKKQEAKVRAQQEAKVRH